ncbi:MAG: flavonol synthase [Flavobacteriales bacterium]|nr:flavonol synthase [Flavobacteriales bacterium]|tara:strand:+ start:9198 stop:10151 length:954 start_codon:yes stop_codon:yes gene_type:complete
MKKETIPSLDLNNFTNGDQQSRQKFFKTLGKGFEEYGFVAIKNHGLTEELTSELYEQVKLFFNLNLDIKKQYERPELNGQRGYISFGRETAKGFKKHDLKEFWHFGQEVIDGDPISKEYEKNVICSELPEFNKIGRKVYQSLEETGKTILKAIALHLNLDENYFENKVHNGNSILRAIHYPPITKKPEGSVRAAAHGDINLITLLMGASNSGLQILNKKNEWISVTALPEQIVVNIGDMLARLTNNKLCSSVHRVINPPKELWGTSRFSIPFFMHPRSEMSLNCLESCISKQNPKNYTDTTAGEFLEERIRELGLKK